MAAKDFGGNTIQNIDLETSGTHALASDPYFFFHYKGNGVFDRLPAEGAITMYVVKASANATLEASGEKNALRDGQVIALEKAGAASIRGEVEVFIAGTNRSVATSPSVRVLESNEVKRVEKPWGYELWLTGEHPQFAFKKLFIKRGTKTSLQYHKHKRETMIFWEGDAALHYRSNPSAQIDRVSAGDVSATPLRPGDLVDVFPNHLHRVEAVSDILLFEVSTPHLDDVIRVSDDSNRVNGRIAEEHGKK